MLQADVSQTTAAIDLIFLIKWYRETNYSVDKHFSGETSVIMGWKGALTIFVLNGFYDIE